MSTLAQHTGAHPPQDGLLERFDDFVGAFHRVDPAPMPFEFAKLDALRDDLVWLQRRGTAASPLSRLGRGYRWFEHWFAVPATSPAPSADAALDAPHGAAIVPAGLPDPLAFGDDQHALDRLSLWYGGQYRGAILLNYVLGVASGGLAVGTRLFHEPVPRAFGAFEVLLILAVAAIYFAGRTPRAAFDGTWRMQTGGRRWHQRWLEYRLLAERLRYAMLLQPFDRGTDSTWVRILRAGGRRPGWFDHYFLWRWSQRPQPEAGLPDGLRDAWCDRLRSVMAEQIEYHREAGSRRRRLVHVLERWAISFFVATAVLIALHALLLWIGVPARASEDGPWHDHAAWVSALAALLTVLGAALHGILRSTELSMIADNSLELVEQLETLRGRLRPLIDARRIEDMQAPVEELCRLVTEEATGWRALLRDKDLPLTH